MSNSFNNVNLLQICLLCLVSNIESPMIFAIQYKNKLTHTRIINQSKQTALPGQAPRSFLVANTAQIKNDHPTKQPTQN